MFRSVVGIHPWKISGAICAPWDLTGHSCPPQLLGVSPAFVCLCVLFVFLQRDGVQEEDPLVF